MNNQSKNQIEKLLELKKLYESGILSKEEMEAEKTKILDNKIPSSEIPTRPVAEELETASPDEEPFFEKYKNYIWGVGLVAAVIVLAYLGWNYLAQGETAKAYSDDIELSADTNADSEVIDTIPSATAFVTEIYNKVLADRTENWEEKYFSEDFYDWYQRTMAYDKENHMGSLGFFDGGDIWTKEVEGSKIIASVTGVSIQEHPADGHTMESYTFPIVEVTLKENGKSTKAYWSLVYYDGSWKIDDDSSKQRMMLYLGQTDGVSGAEMWMNRFAELDKKEYWNEKYLSKDFKAKIRKWNGSGYFDNYNIWNIGSAEWIDKIEVVQSGHSNNTQATLIVAITCNSDDDSPEVRNREVKLIVEGGCWCIDDIDNGKTNILINLKEIGAQ